MGQHTNLYKTACWQRRRKAQLQREPLCRYCQRAGHLTIATVADHIVPHRGDMVAFYGDLQSLCASCHSSTKQAEEAGGAKGSGMDGRPTDPAHHWNNSAGHVK